MSLELPAIVAGSQPSRLRGRFDWRAQRIAWLSSLAIHGVAGIVIAVEIAIALVFVMSPAPPADRVARGFDLPADDRPLDTLPITLESSFTEADVTDEQIAALAASQISPQLEEQLLQPSDPAGESIAAQWVHTRVLKEIAAAEKLSQQDQYRQLEQLTGTLNEVATDESVKEATARLAQLLNAKPRATEPAAEPPPGRFDLETAQLYDVKRADNGQGGFTYTAVLLDAEGRTLDSELTEAEGEQLYRTFELMKANPLLERVYRGVVMSLLDKLLQPAPAKK